MITFTPRLLYSQGRDPRYPLVRRLGRLQSLSGRGGEKENPCPCRGSNPGRPARSLGAIPALESVG